MTIPAGEAASALKEAEAAAGRSEAARGYQMASGYLLLWGVIWLVANLASQVAPSAGVSAWNAGALIGVVGSIALGARQRAGRAGGGSLKAFLVALAIGGFGSCAAAIAPSLSFMQFIALGCLAVGAIYLAMGAGTGGLRLSVVGAAIMAATMVGWFFAREQFFLWMALAGGGGLILGGFWFRKV